MKISNYDPFTFLWKLLFPKKPEPFTISDVKEIPFHIKEVAKLYPILHTVAGNRALGDVKKFNFVEENKLRVGQSMIIKDEKRSHDAIWIHLGNDYFKNVMKA